MLFKRNIQCFTKRFLQNQGIFLHMKTNKIYNGNQGIPFWVEEIPLWQRVYRSGFQNNSLFGSITVNLI